MLSLNVLDYENKLSVEFFSRKYKIDVNPGFLDFLTRHNLDYKVQADVHL